MLRAIAGGINATVSISTKVATYALLPAASSHLNEYAQVYTTTGVPFVNRKLRGLYYSDGSSWIYVDKIDTDDGTQIYTDPTGRVNSGSDTVEAVLDDYDTAISGKQPLATAVVGIVAAGTNQATATALTGDFSLQEIATSSGTTGVRLPAPTTKSRITVVNRGAQALRVYPAVGHSINGLSVNAPIFLYPNQLIEIFGKSTSAWQTMLFSSGAANSLSPQFPCTLTLTSSGVTANTYGNSNSIPQFTVGWDGRINYAGETGVSISYSQVYDFAAGVAAYSTGGLTRGKIQALAENSGA